jgi:hypothetical protein
VPFKFNLYRYCVAAYKDMQMLTSAGPVTCASIAKGTIG